MFQWEKCKFVIFAIFVKTAPPKTRFVHLFCLQLEASCLQWSFFYLQLTILGFLLTIRAFFTYNFSFFYLHLDHFCLQWESDSDKRLKGL